MENLANYHQNLTNSIIESFKKVNLNFSSRSTLEAFNKLTGKDVNLWPNEISNKFAFIYYITAELWKNKDATYEEMQDIYNICYFLNYSSLQTSKIIRNIIIGIHNQLSIIQIYSNCKSI